MTLTIGELEKLQATHPDYRMELVDGEVTIMSPSGYEADEVSTELAAQIRNWVRPRQLGRVTGSSAGFILPNADTRAIANRQTDKAAKQNPRFSGHGYPGRHSH